MKKSVLFSLILFCAVSVAHAEKWKAPTASLRSVFMPKGKSGIVELIRLYSDKTFEHLVYTPTAIHPKKHAAFPENKVSRVEVNRGTYQLQSGKLTLNPKETDFSTKLYDHPFFVENSKAYDQKWKALFRKEEYVLRTVPKNKYNMPFYLDPTSHLIVSNEDAAEKIDLEEVVSFLTKSQTNQKERLEILASFIRNSIEYDEEGAATKMFANDQNNAEQILAGKNRIAVCAGYAACFAKLLQFAGVPARSVCGNARTNAYEIGYRGERHAWNIAQLGEEEKLYDLTWGEPWFDVAPEIMIHSHFPDNPSDQLLKNPISVEQYMQMPHMEPTCRNARSISYLPMRGNLTGKGEVKLIFDGAIQNLIVEQTKMAEGRVLDFPENIKNARTSFSDGKTVVTIPLKFEECMLRLKTGTGMDMSFIAQNNGVVDADIMNFYRSTEKIRAVAPVAAPVRLIKKTEVKTTSIQPNLTGLSVVQQQFFGSVDDQMAVVLLQNPLIREASKYFGLKELAGDQHQAQILTFFKETGHKDIRTDEDAWCSAFVAYCAKMSGLPYSRKATAKSWLNVGKAVEQPKPGDLVIFWREDRNSWKGHVSIYLGADPETGDIRCLGGNQDDQVNVSSYDESYVLGYRRLKE